MAKYAEFQVGKSYNITIEQPNRTEKVVGSVEVVQRWATCVKFRGGRKQKLFGTICPRRGKAELAYPPGDKSEFDDGRRIYAFNRSH